MSEWIIKLIPILNAFRKEIPDCIGYEIYHKTFFTLPKELQQYIVDDNQEIHNLNKIIVSIDNYSLKSKKNIRVIYSGKWLFTPDIKYRRRENTKVKYKILDDEKEIVIDEILPNESVYVILYNTSSDFEIEQILFDDSDITKTMQLLAEIKRDPELAKIKIYNILAIVLLVMMTLIAITGMTWIYMKSSKIARHQALIDNTVNEIYKNFSGCYISVYETKDPKFDEIYVKNRWNSNETLLLNHVQSISELKRKPEVILCINKQDLK